MKYPTDDELVSSGIPKDRWDWIRHDDPIKAEKNLRRYLSLPGFNFDWQRDYDSMQLSAYASGDGVWPYPDQPRAQPEWEPPEDLTGLIPDREEFVRTIKRLREVNASRADDLEAFNEEGRRRAIRLGFPPDSWIVREDEVDYRTSLERLAEEEALEPED